MRLPIIRYIASKEILSTLRDRRALISTLVIPLIMLPVMMVGMPLLIGGLFSKEITAEGIGIGVVQQEHLPAELRTIITASGFEFTEVPNEFAAVEAGTVTTAIRLAAGSPETLGAGGIAEFEVFTKTGNIQSELHGSRVAAALNAYSEHIVAERLAERNIDPALLTPVITRTIDASSEAERSSGQLGWIIPFFIALWVLMGGQTTAIDATAGEKERGTIEALLVAPVKRSEIVAGKFIAIITFGLVSAFMAIGGYLLGGAVMRTFIVPRLGEDAGEIISVMGGSISTNAFDLLLLVVTAILLAAVMAATLMTLTMFARSFKEAQSYIGPLSFVIVLPAVGLQFKDMLGFTDVLYYVPVVNALVAMDDILRGSYAMSSVLTAWAVLAATAAVLLALAHRNFTKETVLFRN